MAKRSMFVGLDVHKESIDISLAEEGRDGEVRHYGVITGDLEALAKVVRVLRMPDRRLRFVYEAGPCGFGIHRYLTAQGAGELTAIYIPTADDEALRDLVRAREDAVGLSTQAKHRLKAFLLRQGRRYPGRAGWTQPYRRWLADLSVPLAPQHIALQEYPDTIDETERRLERLTEQLRQLTPTWRWAPVVDALQALRGVSFVTAVGLVAEIGDIRRFQHPRELMAFLGLVPSEYSSGPSVRRGGITKAGNPHARRLLAEAAWAYQGVPRLGRQMLYRQEALPKPICDIAWKAQLRLTARFRRLVARGNAKPKVATAIARELTGFIWAIAREVPTPAAKIPGDQVRRVGGIAARWRTLEVVMDIGTIDTSAPRARQLRDEPQSGRYSTRGYQQRQPSLKRGVADQTDLKNEAHDKSVLKRTQQR
jgi:transposase